MTTQKQTTEPLVDAFPELVSAINTFVDNEQNIAQSVRQSAQQLADAFTLAFAPLWWGRVEEKSETGTAIRKGKKELYAGLKRIGHSNPSVVWARILTAAGKPVVEKAAEPRALDTRIIEEVSKLYKAVNKADDASSNAREALAYMQDILETMGAPIPE